MATILTKRSNTAASVPLAAQLTNSSLGAELAVNTTDKRLFTKDGSGNVVELGTSPSTLGLPNGTANGVAYLNGSKVLTSGSALVFDGSNLSTTGIVIGNSAQFTGANAPASGSGAELLYTGTTAKLQAYNRTGSAWLPLTFDASYLAFNTSGGEKARIDNVGNLGLGVTPSAWSSTGTWFRALDMQNGGALATFQNGISSQLITNAFFNGSVWVYKLNGAAGRYVNSGSSHNWDIAPSGTAGNTITFTQAMTLDASGNLGIGTSSPSDSQSFSRALDMRGSTGSAYYSATSDNITRGYFATFTGGVYVGSETDHPLIFRTNNAERARIDSSGNLLVGTTGAGGRISAYLGTASTTATPGLYLAKYDNDNTTNQVYVRFAYNQNTFTGGQINGNGANQAAFGSWSDRRLKENITDLPNQLENILSLRPVEFDYKAGGHQIGFIAQEMQEVYPDSVGEDGSNDNYLTITGWSKTEARLVKAIQEQQALITSLTARIAALESAA